jgi:hypothetical protein
MKLIAFLISTAISCSVGLLAVYVLRDVAELFGLWFIGALTFLQTYGCYVLFKLLNFRFTKKDLKEVLEDAVSEFGQSLGVTLISAIGLLVFWGLSYVMHAVIA